MLTIHPFARILCVLMIGVAAIFVGTLSSIGGLYSIVAFGIFLTGILRVHLKFVVLVTSPLLLALLFVWGWAADPSQIPTPHKNGATYAVFVWLRIAMFGGLLQWLLLPLLEHPTHLRDFMTKSGLSGPLGTLLLTSIVFVPEVKRRLARVIDARRALGHSLRGFKGLQELPILLMPLVSSLLDSAAARSELWDHRGLLSRSKDVTVNLSYNAVLSGFSALIAVIACVVAVFA